MSDRPLYFLHIPKTAGSSLYCFLANHFDASDIFEGSFPEEARLVNQRKNPPKLVRGHFFSCKQFFDPLKVDFLTVIAHPAQRYVSQVKHIVRLDFLASDTYLIPNIQTFFLARDLAFPIMGPMLARMSEDQLYAMALERVQSAYWVGLRDRYASSLLLLSLYKAWRPIGIEISENVAPSQSSNIGIGMSNWFNDTNHSDIELWQAATKRFDHDVESVLERINYADLDSAWFAEQMAKLSHIGYGGRNVCSFDGGSEVDTLHRAAMMVYLRRREHESTRGAANECEMPIVIGASAPFNGDGWHRREIAPEVSPYYWSGPESVSDVHLPCKLDGDVTITVHLVAWNDEITPQELIISLDGERMSIRCEYHNELPGCLVRCRGRAAPTGLKFSVLRFDCPRTKPLIEFTGAPDTRKVGFAFRSILVSD